MIINRVAIIGAGAIGSYFIAGLSEKLGENLWVIAEGDRRERLQKNGIVINGNMMPLHVKTAREAATEINFGKHHKYKKGQAGIQT